MLQTTATEEMTNTLTINGVKTDLKVGDKLTAIFYMDKTSLDWWYFKLKWFIGDFSDAKEALEKGLYIKFDKGQIPFDKKVDLYKVVDGVKTDKYQIPKVTTGNYGWVTEASAYPLLRNLQEEVPMLNDNLISGGY
tara:strand:+ start:6416 stop:6823 length:408 start_codon:yes stop_codon:yes gene_type:complete